MKSMPTEWRCRDHRLVLGKTTLIMGILNVTPDSFSDGGRFVSIDKALEQSEYMIQAGADIIDVGGESTRPGAEPVSLAEEMGRVIPVIEKLCSMTDIPISIDTVKSQIAKKAIKAGASIVNDISGLTNDPEMVRVIAESGAGLVLMHIKGNPENMQIEPNYGDLLGEIEHFFNHKVRIALDAGVQPAQIVLDPGIGFGKKLADNFVLIRHIDRFKALGYPVLMGPSRKSFIGKILDLPAEKRLEGTLAAVTASILYGCDIVRVHDVVENKCGFK